MAWPPGPDEQRRRGSHPTPPAVVRYLVEASLARWRGATDGVRVLDPACGDGAFLAGALAWLAQRAAPAGPVDERALAARHLTGVDIDARAVEAASRRLPGARIELGDALDRRFAAREYDVILGNPPYVFGEHLDRSQAFRSYELGRGCQLDLFKLFYERTLGDLLRPGGVHAFLVPDALLARDEHADLRAFIARRARLERICHIGRAFPGVGVGVAAIVCVKHPAAAVPVRIDRWDAAAGEARFSHELAPERLVDDRGGPWCAAAPSAWWGEGGLRARLEGSGVALGDVLAPGVAGLTRGEELGKSSLEDCPRPGEPGPGAVAICAGADVERHVVHPPRRQVPLSAMAKPASIYRGPKVLVVKTGGGVVAAGCADDRPVLQSVYVLHLAPSWRGRLGEDALAGLLSSALVTAYARYRWTSGKALQPQLTLADVRRLPLPRLDAPGLALLDETGRLVAAIRSGLAAGRRVASLERRLDRAVARAFGLELREWVPVISPALDALPASQRPRWWVEGGELGADKVCPEGAGSV